MSKTIKICIVTTSIIGTITVLSMILFMMLLDGGYNLTTPMRNHMSLFVMLTLVSLAMTRVSQIRANKKARGSTMISY